jgi:predicted nucleic acid-binding protein
MAGNARKSSPIVVRSDALPGLRQFIELQADLKTVIGPIATYPIVVDANILIRELLWLSTKRKNPDARPELLECLIAQTVVAYVPMAVIVEVERNMETLAPERDIPADVWTSHWASYKPLLRVEEPDPLAVARYAAVGRDPTDAPTLALADILAVCGILTDDPDIKATGGKAIPISFKLELREYSRQAAVFVSLQIGGCYVAIGAVEALSYAVKTLGRMLGKFRTLPDWVKIVAVAAVALAIIHPTSRTMIGSAIKAVGAAVADAIPGALAFLLQVAQMFEEHRAVPPTVTHM